MRAVPAGPGAYSLDAYVRTPSGSPVAGRCQRMKDRCCEWMGGWVRLRSMLGSRSAVAKRPPPGRTGDAVGLRSCQTKKHHMTRAASPRALTGRAIAIVRDPLWFGGFRTGEPAFKLRYSGVVIYGWGRRVAGSWSGLGSLWGCGRVCASSLPGPLALLPDKLKRGSPLQLETGAGQNFEKGRHDCQVRLMSSDTPRRQDKWPMRPEACFSIPRSSRGAFRRWICVGTAVPAPQVQVERVGNLTNTATYSLHGLNLLFGVNSSFLFFTLGDHIPSGHDLKTRRLSACHRRVQWLK